MNAAEERVAGYRDGMDPDSPEPSTNRSESYRHGFAVARSDRAQKPAFGSSYAAKAHAEWAEREDESA